MKKKLLIINLLAFLFVFIQLNAQEESSTNKKGIIRTHDVDRTFYLDKQLDIYRNLPSNLQLWENGDFSVTSFNGSYDKGDFKMVDEYNTNKLISFHTESVQTIEKNGWRFYGAFKLELGNYETSKWNMFFKKSDIGSPFRLITERNGDWNSKHYGLDGTVSKKINEKLFLGLGVQYHGDLYLRIRDVRNEQYNLFSELIFSASYQLSENKHVGFGLSYVNQKSEPSFNAEYKVTGTEFDIHVLNGLADFIDVGISDKMYILNQSPKLYLSYFSGNKNKLSISYTFYPGKELWKNRITSLTSTTPEKIYKYEYLDNTVVASYLINKPASKILNKLNARFISGNAYQNRSGFQKTYINTQLNVELTSDILREDQQLFHHSTFGLLFKTSSKKDMIYAPEMDISNLTLNTGTSFYIPVNSKSKLNLKLKAGYRYNLTDNYITSSAKQKLYTLNIAYNELAVKTADIIKMGADLTLHKKMNSISAEFKLGYNYVTPTNIKLHNQNSILEKTDNRNYWCTSINLFF